MSLEKISKVQHPSGSVYTAEKQEQLQTTIIEFVSTHNL